MLRMNSKKAKENIKKYIMEHADFNNYCGFDGYEDFIEEPKDFKTTAKQILIVFDSEKFYQKNDIYTFIEWCGGLPSVLDTCYYYNRSAIKDLGDILEESEEERNKFSEQQAEEMLSKLIYRELTNAIR